VERHRADLARDQPAVRHPPAHHAQREIAVAHQIQHRRGHHQLDLDARIPRGEPHRGLGEQAGAEIWRRGHPHDARRLVARAHR